VSVELEWPDGVEQLTYQEFERRVQDGLVPPDTPIKFEVVTGQRFVPVGDLELYEALAGTGVGDFRESLRKFAPPIFTALILGIQLRLYLYSLSADHRTFLIEHFANWSPAVFEQAQIFRLFSYGLIHVNFSHFLINGLFIAYLGWNLERGLGHKNFITLWVASVFVGGVLSILMTPMRPSIGASAGAFGLLAAGVVFGWKHGDQIPKSAVKFFGWGILPYLIFSLTMGLNSSSVDNWGHIGGLLTGGLLATILEPESLKTKGYTNSRIRWLTAITVLGISAVFVIRGSEFVRLEQHEERGFTATHPATWERNWTPSGDRGWVSPSFSVSIVSRTAQYERALNVDSAVDAFVGQVEIWGDDVVELASKSISLGPFAGLDVEYRFSIRGVEQGLRAMVVPRGRYLHMIYIQTELSQFERYRDLSQRLFDGVAITPPPGLLRARNVAAAPTSSSLDYLALGVEAGRAGYHLEASQAFRSVMESEDTTGVVDAALGLINLYADYGAGISIEEVLSLADRFNMNSEIQLAVSEVLLADGLVEEARDILNRAWQVGLQEFSVREALLNMGLTVEDSTD